MSGCVIPRTANCISVTYCLDAISPTYGAATSVGKNTKATRLNRARGETAETTDAISVRTAGNNRRTASVAGTFAAPGRSGSLLDTRARARPNIRGEDMRTIDSVGGLGGMSTNKSRLNRRSDAMISVQSRRS